MRVAQHGDYHLQSPQGATSCHHDHVKLCGKAGKVDKLDNIREVVANALSAKLDSLGHDMAND